MINIECDFSMKRNSIKKNKPIKLDVMIKLRHHDLNTSLENIEYMRPDRQEYKCM